MDNNPNLNQNLDLNNLEAQFPELRSNLSDDEWAQFTQIVANALALPDDGYPDLRNMSLEELFAYQLQQFPIVQGELTEAERAQLNNLTLAELLGIVDSIAKKYSNPL